MNNNVVRKFDLYPAAARKRLLELRTAIYKVAAYEGIGEVTETFKWGEPAYIVKHGSTVRIDWKPTRPDHVSVYFNCNTKLVETFKALYSDIFQIVGNREIQLATADNIPMPQIMSCISMSLRYHKIKHLPLLGASCGVM